MLSDVRLIAKKLGHDEHASFTAGYCQVVALPLTVHAIGISTIDITAPAKQNAA
jgi:hypothetical protein